MKRLVLSILLLLAIIDSAHGFCFEDAGRFYDISPALLSAIAEVESGMNPTAMNHNKDGSVDVGLMQINSFWKDKLGSWWTHVMEPCFNVYVGAWILAQCMGRYGYSWKAVGCYHRGKWDSLAVNYVRRVQNALEK